MRQGVRVRSIGGFAWLAAMAAIQAADAHALDAAAIAERNAPAVLLILGAGADGAVIQGSGCIVDAAQGLALTTAHQVRNADAVRGVTRDGAEFRFDVVEIDANADLAVLRTAEALPGAAVLGSGEPPPAGAEVVAVSSPLGIAFSTHTGHVTNTRYERRGIVVLLTDLPLTNGSSGGPVFDEHGALIGLVSERIDAAASTVVAPISQAMGPLCRAGANLAACGALPGEEPAMAPGGGDDAAAAAYNRAVRERDPARKAALYKEAVALRPAFFEAWFNLGIAHGAAKDWTAAAEAYGRARDLRPDAARVRRNLGQALLHAGRNAEGAAELERAADLAPDDERAHNDLGEAYRRLERYADAAEAFDRALALRPAYPEAHFNLALTLVRLGRTAGAVRHFEAYLDYAPDAADAAQVRARIEALQSKESAE